MSKKHDIMEVLNGLTGFDEIAIEKAFSASVYNAATDAQVTRMALFVVFRREGKNDPVAYQDAMNVAVSKFEDYFEKPQDESLGDQIAQTLEGTEESGEA